MPITAEDLGKVFSYENELYLEQEIETYKDMFLDCLYDEKEPVRFAQNQAELKGKIMLLQGLLEQSRSLKSQA